MYPTTADLVAASTVPALTDLTGDQQDALRTAAIVAVEGHCGQQFTPVGSIGAPAVRRIDGSGGDTLYLPARISELVSVRILGPGAGLSVDQVQISDDRQRLTVRKDTVGSSWLDRVSARETGAGPVFPVGVDNIEVAGIWGWTDSEYTAHLGAVTTALRMDMEDKALAGAHDLADTVRASRALGVGAVRQGRLSIDLSADEPDLSARARRQLTDLVFTHLGGATV